MRLPLAVSVGDPAGIGPEIAVEAAAHFLERDALVLYGDAGRLGDRLDSLGVPSRRVDLDPSGARVGEVGLVHVGDVDEATIDVRSPSAEGGRHQLAALSSAWECVRRGSARALVTGPTSKEAVTRSGTAFTGQTEYLAESSGLGRDDVTMMFLGPKLLVSLVTTHVSIRHAPDQITEPRVERSIRHLHEAMMRLYPDCDPFRIIVSGLNPHAGEGGLFGREDIERIAPAIATYLESIPEGQRKRLDLEGPAPAEAAFRRAVGAKVVGVVAMLHDQATIASKLVDWGRAVNVTWGLPALRTSVDHGVAYDIAGSGRASAEGMIAAVEMARRLTHRMTDRMADRTA